MRKLFTFLLALAASVGMSWATTTDLASITGDYTAQDGEILTGTLGVNVKISIADDATVTLLNANINGDKTWTTGDYAGLTCLGNATIKIVGTNSVSGFSTDQGYPGIYVPSGKTLIINGTGSLTAQSSTEEAAGIGAGYKMHCGNIEIQSGKITAIAGGEEGAGIGGALNGNCGNITISGGIVTAVGGYRGAGIGGGKRSGSTDAGHCGNILISGGVVSATSGEDAAAIGGGRGNNNAYKSNCGTITITSAALKVYADQGGNANTIGAGKYNNCGKVTIGGIEGVINTDPYTYRTKEDGAIVVDYINAIGTVVYTQECKDKIDIARELYDALEDSQKDLVINHQTINYQTLLDAEAAYAALIPQPVTTHTLQLHVNDAVMGSVALQNPSNDIIDNGNGTYTVPEGAEVTLQATPNEGYEFIGWKASSSICDFNECEFVDLHKDENPLTVDMYTTAAFMAEFAAVAPQPQPVAVDGKLPGAFSVSPTQKVNFSQGNLRATTDDNGTTWTWAFAADQLTFVGNATANTAINGNGTVSANGTVDLFGWSTAATKYGINNSLDNSTYSGDFVDWGSNPDLIATLGKGWRTLTSAEWTYLLNTRTTTSGVRYAKAIVDGKNGLIILPDDWSESYHALASANTDNVAYTYNTFDAAIWSSDFEAHGAVFLPAAGYRRDKDVEHLGDFANYWSASPDGASYAWYLAFSESFFLPAYNYNRVTGEAVRLVSDIAPAPQPQTAVVIGDPNDATEIEAFLTNNNGQTIDELIIDRPVLNNMYNTLCLPFDMNAAQIAASSLNGVEIREFTGASVEGTTLNLSVGDPVNAVVAGRPYFVKYSAASQLDDLHFEDVTINNALLDNMAVTFDGVTFKGTFTPFIMPNGLNFQGGYLFLGQNNQLFWPNTSNPLKPFRAYFYVDVESSTPGNAPKYRGMPARIVEGKNVATGVENAQSANQSTKVIVNGQLIIIKNDVRYNAQGQVVK